MILDGLRKTLAQNFFGRINVHKLDEAFITDLVPTHKVRENIEIQKLEANMTASVLTLPVFSKKLQCTVKKLKFTFNQITVRKFKIKRYTKQDIKVHSMPKHGMNTFSGTKRIQALPQERANLLKFVKNKPAIAKNEMLLAWYSPIVDSAVIKLALNKSRGTLLVWYNPSSRQVKAKGVYLIRRLGLGEKPEWRWV